MGGLVALALTSSAQAEKLTPEKKKAYLKSIDVSTKAPKWLEKQVEKAKHLWQEMKKGRKELETTSDGKDALKLANKIGEKNTELNNLGNEMSKLAEKNYNAPESEKLRKEFKKVSGEVCKDWKKLQKVMEKKKLPKDAEKVIDELTQGLTMECEILNS